MNIKRKQSTPVADLFHPVEHAILADYLRVIPPKTAQDIDPFSEEELQITDDSPTSPIQHRKNDNPLISGIPEPKVGTTKRLLP